MSTSLHSRHFARFICRIKVVYTLGGLRKEFTCSTEFICAFCLRQLIACVRPFKYMPGKYCLVDLEFEYLEPSVDTHSLSLQAYKFYVCHNYESIVSRIVRTIMFNFIINDFAHEEECFPSQG